MSAWASRVRWGSLGVILLVIGVRALCEHARIPWWDFDPLVSPIPETRITPALGLVLDAVMVVCAACMVGAQAMAGRTVRWFAGLLVVAGMVGVALHGWVLRAYGGADTVHGDTRALTIGAMWAAAVAGGYALSLAARDREVRRVIAGVVLGVGVPVAAIGAVQVFVEHARMVDVFDADPQSALAAAGITPGTTAAATFERRMRQAEATGPFGLANVFGTVMAAGAVFWGIVAIGAVRERVRGAMWIGVVGFGAGAVGLWMCGSKGAAAAAVFGAAFVAIARWMPGKLRERRWVGIVLGIGLIVVPLGAVAARGMVGERIGELSLLFRAQYAEASGRIIAEHPVLGVGPGNFKAAYLIAKNPLNPEQVESPHSVMMDWVSTLGLFGAAWAVVLICAAGAIGVSAASSDGTRATSSPWHKDKSDTSRSRTGELVAIVVPVAAVVASVGIAHGMIGQERATALLVGTGVWVVVAWVLARTVRMDWWMGLACAGAGAVAIAHGMIEVTPVMPGSAAWWAAVVGVAVGAFAHERPARRWNGAGGLVVCACLVAWAGMVGVRAVRLFEWEGELRDAYAYATDETQDWFARGDVGWCLEGAWSIAPSFTQVAADASRVFAMSGPEWVTTPLEIADQVVAQFPGRSDAWLLRANVALASGPSDREAAFAALSRAAELDPWSLSIAVRLADIAELLDDGPNRSRWARRALEIDDLLRLDPVVRLSPNDRARMEALSGVGSEKGHPDPEP